MLTAFATAGAPPNFSITRSAGELMNRILAETALRLQEKSCDIRTTPMLRFSQNGLMDIGWIRDSLKKPGKTQRGLAAALGIDPTGVSRLLSGERQLKAAELDKVHAYFAAKEPQSAPAKTSQLTIDQPRRSDNDPLRVLGMAEGDEDGWQPFNGDVIETIPRPANLVGVPDAYAVYISGDSMSPRYLPGEKIHIHPHKPVSAGAFVLVQKRPKSPGEAPKAIVKRLVKRSGNRVVLAQYNPEKTFEVKADEVVLHRIVGSGE